MSPTASRFTQISLLTIILIGFGLRLPLLDRFSFREDEAIYAYWALHAWHEDPLFLTVWPDKPPLFLWLLSGTFQLFGPSAASARWISIALSTLTIPLVAAIVNRLTPKYSLAAWISAAALALNPFAISFAPTAFTDPTLVFCGTVALCCACYQRSFWAGVWLAAAIMTKQQGLLYLPLVFGMLFIYRSSFWRDLLYASIGLLLVCAPILYWDSLRWSVAPSPWDLSVRNYGALALLPADKWIERARVWSSLSWYLTASTSVWWLLAAAVGILVIIGSRRYSWLDNLILFRPRLQGGILGQTDQKMSAAILLLLLWAIAFLALHIITTIQPWDRYLLPLAPVLALFVGCALAQFRRGRARVLAIVFWLVLSATPAVRAATGYYPIGGDHGGYAGFDEAVAWINAELSAELNAETAERAILYHRALGWHYRYYFYNEVRTGDYELRWFRHAIYLADNATGAPHRRRFLIEPTWSPVRDLAQHTTIRQLDLEKRAQFGEFTIFELSHQPKPFCDWCLCRLPNGWAAGI